MSDEQKPADLQAQPAVLTATIQIVRAKTGGVETYEIVGTPIEQPKPKEAE
jgi:hypothetical protein